MAALKSAMRQPHAHHPPPTELPHNHSSPSQHDLRSRFSAETLMIRSPSQALRSIFSTSTAASSATATASLSPTSSLIAASTRRYHRRISLSHAAKAARAGMAAARPGHQPAASESYLDLTSPTFAGGERDRAESTVEDAELSRTDASPASRSRSRSRSRRPSFRSRTSSIGGHSMTAADKLAGAAKGVLDKLANLRGGHGHSRQDSEASLEIRRRSISTPSIAPVAVRTSPDPDRLPRDRAQTAPEPSPSASSSRSGTPSGSARRGRLPELAAARPRPKHLPVNPRPASPPSPTIPPLRPAPPVAKKDRRLAESRVQPFSAQATAVPRADILNADELDELFVRIDVGGQSTYTTTVATLLGSSDGGGKLGEFVGALLAEAAIENETSHQSAPICAQEGLRVELPLSPFPFADSSSDSGHLVAGDDPASPIDPLISTAAATLFGRDLFLPPPAIFALSDKAFTSAPSPGQKALFVPSPTTPSGFKHKSIHPDTGSQATLCEGSHQFTPPSSVSSGSSASFSIDVLALEGSSGDEATPSAKQPPFFTILRDQVARPEMCAQRAVDLHLAGEKPAVPAVFSARESLAFPQTISNRSESSVGVDAIEIQPAPTPLSHLTRLLPDVSSRVATTLRESVKRPASRVQTPALVRNATVEERTVSIFLDRTNFPLSPPHLSIPEAVLTGSVSTYAAILAFIRGAAFPAAVSPTFPATNDRIRMRADAVDVPLLDLSRLARADPRVALNYLGNFATLRAECAWLGLRTAECEALAQVELLERMLSQCAGQKSSRVAAPSTEAGREGWI